MSRTELRVSVCGGTFLARVFDEVARCPKCGAELRYEFTVDEEGVLSAPGGDNEFIRSERRMAVEDAVQAHFLDCPGGGRRSHTNGKP